MTESQKYKIQAMRSQGLGYKTIGDILGLSMGCVKVYCFRNGLDTKTMSSKIPSDGRVCPQCGKELIQKSGTKKRRFCSSECRQLWWNNHRSFIKHHRTIEQVCLYCGKTFEAFPSAGRKFCSHKCYINKRFKINS